MIKLTRSRDWRSDTIGWGDGAQPTGSAKWALTGLSLAMLLPSLATSIANATLPALARVFGAPFAEVQWVILSYLLAVTVLVLPMGRLGDLIGRRRLLLSGVATFTTGSLLCGAAPDLPLLIIARAAQGAGAAMMTALTLAFVNDVVPDTRRGSAIGLLGSMSAIGTTIGPPVGGLLMGLVEAQAVFLIVAPPGVLAFLLVLYSLPQDRGQAADARRGFDLPGTALLGGALAAYALGMTVGRGNFGLLNVVLLVVAVVAGAMFLVVERKTTAPLVRLALLSNRPLSSGLAASVLVSAVMMSTLIVGPFYLNGALELDPATMGLVLAAGPLVAVLAGIPAGRLVDRYGAGKAGHSGLIALATGAAALSLISTEFGVAGYLVPIVTMTAGYGLFQAAHTTGIMADVSPAERGTVSGMISLARNFGLVTGTAAMGAIFVFGCASADAPGTSPHAITAGVHLTFAVATLLILVALAISVSSTVRDGDRMISAV